MTEVKFLKLWIKDDEVREYDTVDCIPPGCVVPPRTFNTWQPYRAATLPPVPDDQVDELVSPILKHFETVVCATKAEVDYLLAWKAQQIQKPATKSEVGIILSGPQGAGKNIETSWFADSVLGSNAAYTTSKIQQILGKHSTVLQNKVHVVLDEANYEALKPFADGIKDLMTGKTLALDPKYKDAFTTRSLVNFTLTTNNAKSVHLEAGDRRWVVLEVNDSRKGDTAYFDALAKHLKNDKVARGFYQYLLKFDLTEYGNFQAKRPHTRLYEEMKEENLSTFHSFMSHECIRCAGEKPMFSPVANEVGCCEEKTKKTPEYPATAFFETFKTWAAAANHDIGPYTRSKFGLDLGGLMKKTDSGVVKKRNGQHIVYSVEWSTVEKCLKLHGLFNTNV